MVKVIKVGGGILKNDYKYSNILHYIFGSAKKEKLIVVVSAIGRNLDPYSTDGLTKSIIGPLKDFEKDRLKAIGETYAVLKVTADIRKMRLKTKSFSYRQFGLIIENNKYKFNSRKIKELLKDYDVLVVPGYIGKSKDDEPATLNREGSDFSAAIIAKGLGLKEFYLFKDMPGIYDSKGNIHNEITYKEYESIVSNFSSPIGKECIEFSRRHKMVIKCLNVDSIIVLRITNN